MRLLATVTIALGVITMTFAQSSKQIVKTGPDLGLPFSPGVKAGGLIYVAGHVATDAQGQVIKGDQIGHELGFPTANLDTANLILPPNGVYAARTKFRNKVYRVALNIGLRPTVTQAKPQIRVEAHLLDFSGKLYGEELEVEIGEKLREELKFASSTELREQIGRDVELVRGLA